MNYYNEFDPLKAEVLREAMKAGAIAPGDVDERSIADVRPGDLVGYTQCHFFAGGGFWSLALRHAGWPDERGCWTGSCPCPSFSAAGKGGGFDDPRHLWPHWAELIRECKPAVVFGEQADDAVGYGWLDLVQTDLEAAAYAVGKIVFGACSVGAPHIRQRLYFCADTESKRSRPRLCDCWEGGERGHQFGDRCGDGVRACNCHCWRCRKREGNHCVRCDADLGADTASRDEQWLRERGSRLGSRELPTGRYGSTRNLADANGRQSSDGDLQRGGEQRLFAANRGIGIGAHARLPSRLAELQHEPGRRLWREQTEVDAAGSGECGEPISGADAIELGRGARRPSDSRCQGGDALSQYGSESGGRDDAQRPGSQGHAGDVREWRGPGWLSPQQARSIAEAGATGNFWADCDWWYGRDDRYRPIGPGLQPLAHGSAARVGRLRLYGDAIVVPQAAEFIEAYLEARGDA